MKRVAMALIAIVAAQGAAAKDEKVCATDMVCASKPETVVAAMQKASIGAATRSSFG